jgi:hypothetical protein
MPETKYLLGFLVLVSCFGLVLANIVAINPPSVDSMTASRGIVGTGIIVLSLLGILAVVYPKRCSSLTRLRPSPGGTESETDDSRAGWGGHHPGCSEFGSHVFRIGRENHCVGCTGMLLGGVAIVGLSFTYFLVGMRLWNDDRAAVTLGTVLVGLALAQFCSDLPWRAIRFILNATFPVGAFLVLAGLDGLAGSLEVGLSFMLVVVFWLITRIFLASWNHERICRKCTLTQCPDAVIPG